MKLDRQKLYAQWEPASGRRSLAAFAREVHTAWKEILQGDPALNVRSLGVEIERWLSNKTEFRKHPELQQAIARVLEVDVAAQFPGPGRRDPALYPFAEFPALGAFDPRRDEPCCESGFELPATTRSRGDWFESLVEMKGCTWFTAPPGAGRSFVAHWHRHRTPECSVITCQSLSDAELRGLPAGPLLVEVEAAGPEDMGVTKQLRAHGVVVVLAPFDRPTEKDVPGASDRPVHPAQRRSSGWFDCHWRGGREWRGAFVAWTSTRIERLEREFKLDAPAVLQWLDVIDPHCEFFNTPGDLLPILQAAQEEGVKRFRQRFGPAFARNWQQRLAGEVAGDGWRQRWSREEGVSTLERMVSAWWCEPNLPWGDGLTLTEWESLVPKDAVPADEDRPAEEPPQATHDSRGLGERGRPKRARRAPNAVEKSVIRLARPRDVVLALRGARLLRERGIDRLFPVPRWAVDLFAREVLRQAIVEGPPDVWGRWAVDPARQRLVDHALVELPADALRRVVARAVTAFRPEHLGSVGAVESLFLTVGRRLARGDDFDTWEGTQLVALRDQQLATLVCRSTDGLPGPRTRGGPWEPQAGGAAWIAACWVWSFVFERSPPVLPAGYAWLFPGWLVPSLDAVPTSLQAHDSPSTQHPLEEWGCRHLFWLAPVVLMRCEGTYANQSSRYPSFIDAAVIATASQRAWPDEVLLDTLRRVATLDILADRIGLLPKEEQRNLLDRIWRALLQRASVSEFFQRLDFIDPPGRDRTRPRLSVLLDAQFPVEEVCERMASAGHGLDVARILARTPTRHHAAIARAVWRHHPGRAHELIDVLAAQGRELIDVLLEMSESKRADEVLGANVGGMAARAVWQIAPDLAREREEQAYARGEPLYPWTSYRSHTDIGEIVDLVERHPTRVPPADLLRWFARLLLEAGPLAGRIHAVLEREKWRDLLPPGGDSSTP